MTFLMNRVEIELSFMRPQAHLLQTSLSVLIAFTFSLFSFRTLSVHVSSRFKVSLRSGLEAQLWTRRFRALRWHRMLNATDRSLQYTVGKLHAVITSMHLMNLWPRWLFVVISQLRRQDLSQYLRARPTHREPSKFSAVAPYSQ